MLTRWRERICWNMASYTLDIFRLCCYSSFHGAQLTWMPSPRLAGLLTLSWAFCTYKLCYCKASPTRPLQDINVHSNCLVHTCVRKERHCLSATAGLFPSKQRHQWLYVSPWWNTWAATWCVFFRSVNRMWFHDKMIQNERPTLLSLGEQNLIFLQYPWSPNESPRRFIGITGRSFSSLCYRSVDLPHKYPQNPGKKSKKYQMPTRLITVVKPEKKQKIRMNMNALNEFCHHS